jgi:hypothetical protein
VFCPVFSPGSLGVGVFRVFMGSPAGSEDLQSGYL